MPNAPSIETESYRPSNGTEGEGFRSRFCDRCEKDRYPSRPCGIFARTLIHDLGEKDYPREWVRDAGPWPGNPRCTAFIERGSRKQGELYT